MNQSIITLHDIINHIPSTYKNVDIDIYIYVDTKGSIDMELGNNYIIIVIIG